MIKIVVGSKNPVKISATRTAICDVLNLKEVECVGINATSKVSEQPMKCIIYTSDAADE